MIKPYFYGVLAAALLLIPTVTLAQSGATSTAQSERSAARAEALNEWIENYSWPDEATKQFAKETVKTSIGAVFQLELNSPVLQAVGTTPEFYTAYLLVNPDVTATLITQSAAQGMAEDAAIAFFTHSLGDWLLAGPLSGLSKEYESEVRAAINATGAELYRVYDAWETSKKLGPMAGGQTLALAAAMGALARAQDLVEIYNASHALAKTREGGLISVATGLELNGNLRAIGGEKATRLATQWREETTAGLGDIVGDKEADTVAELMDLTLQGLVYQRIGDDNNAKDSIANMVALLSRSKINAARLTVPSYKNLPSNLATIASGESGAEAAFKIFLAGTALGELYGDKSGAWDDDRLVQSTLNAIKASYPARETRMCRQAHGPLSQEELTLLLAGNTVDVFEIQMQRSFSSFVSNSKISRGRLCLKNPISCASVYACASGEMLFTYGSIFHITGVQRPEIPADFSAVINSEVFPQEGPTMGDRETACRLASTVPDYNAFEWSGECKDGLINGVGDIYWYTDGKLTYATAIGDELGIELRKGKLHYNVDLSQYDFELTGCDQGTSGYRVVTITPPATLPKGYFANDWIARMLLEKGAELAQTLCPVERKGLENIAVIIPSDDQYRPAVRGRNYDKNQLSWREYSNTAAQERTAQMRQRAMAIAAAKLKKEQEVARQKIIDLRLAAEMESFAKWEHAFASSDPWDNTSDMLRHDPARATAFLADGKSIIFEIGEFAYVDGATLAAGYQPWTNIYEAAERANMDSLNERFTMDAWMKQINIESRRFDKNGYDLVCRLPPKKASSLKVGGRYQFHAKLISLAGSRAEFDCKLEKTVSP